jgi:hypothetical protein
MGTPTRARNPRADRAQPSWQESKATGQPRPDEPGRAERSTSEPEARSSATTSRLVLFGSPRSGAN